MPLAGITDTGVHLIVCFVVMGVCVCYIGIYVHRYKTDSVEKITLMTLYVDVMALYVDVGSLTLEA